MIKYQGEDIEFKIELKPALGAISNFNELTNFILHAYTEGCNVVKFSINEKAGYESFNLIGTNTITGVLKSEHTKVMLGNLIFEIMCESPTLVGDIKDNSIKITNTGIKIIKSRIKHET